MKLFIGGYHARAVKIVFRISPASVKIMSRHFIEPFLSTLCKKIFPVFIGLILVIDLVEEFLRLARSVHYFKADNKIPLISAIRRKNDSPGDGSGKIHFKVNRIRSGTKIG